MKRNPSRQTYKNTTDQRDFKGCGDDVEDHRGQEETYTFGTSINGSRQTTSLSR